MRDSTLLDMPTTKNLWFVFSFSIATAIALFVLLFAQPDNDLLWVLATLVAIPCWLVGFAIPVFAWWSYSTRCLGLPTRRHEAESVLSAGFLSTFPAVVINSFLFPLLLMVFTIEPTGQLGEFLIVTISAPVGEELCKAAAVLACYRLIDSPRRGFQIGFTVGLGFAMLENILYITSSFSMGFAGFATTAFVRGIGSIPGHAIWTGLSGLGIGWALHRQPDLGGMLPQKQSAPTADFVLFNAKTGQSVDDATGTGMTMWNLNQIKQGNLSENPWALPSTAMTGLVLAILGHAFWNGSVTAVSYLAIKTLGEALGMLIMIVYTFAMIGALLWAGRNIMRSLPSVPGS